MNSPLFSILKEVKNRHIVLDSNLLVLHITAAFDAALISKFKRTQMFSEEDAIFLASLLDQFSGVITTAHIMTEASNLGNSLSYIARDGWFAALGDFAKASSEQVLPCRQLSESDEFHIFGITDSALSALSENHTVLTTDGRLAAHLQALGRSSLNFNELKQLA